MSETTDRSAAVAANLRAELARRQVEVRQLADHLGLSTSTMSRRMSGGSEFTIGEVLEACEFLGCTVADLTA